MFSKKRRLQQKVKDLLYTLASSTHDHFHDLVLVFLGSEGGARLTLTWSEALVQGFGGTAVPAPFFRLPTPYLKLIHQRNMKSQSSFLQTTWFVSTKHARVALCAVQDGAHIPSGREVREVSPKQERCMQ